MEATKTAARGTRVLITLACTVIVLRWAKEAADLLVPLVFSAFLAVVSAPAVLWLQRRRVPTVVSVPLVVLGVFAVLAGFGAFLAGTVSAFIEEAPSYQARLDGLVVSAAAFAEQHGIEVSRDKITSMVDPGAALDVVGGTLSTLGTLLSNVLLVIFVMAFVLFEVTDLPIKVRRAMEDPDGDISHLTNMAREVKQYVVIKTYISFGTGILVAVILSLLGVDFAILWGVLAFLLNYIPNIGSVIAAVPPVLLALVQYGPVRALVVLGAFIAVNMVVGNVVEPALMGRRLGLSSLVVFVSLVFWGWMWGTMGMLLSVPLTMIFKIMLENTPQFRWIATLMGSVEPQARREEDLRISSPPASRPPTSTPPT